MIEEIETRISPLEANMYISQNISSKALFCGFVTNTVEASTHHSLGLYDYHKVLYIMACTSYILNPLRATFSRDNINVYLHFMSFLHTNKTQVVEKPPRVKQGPAYST